MSRNLIKGIIKRHIQAYKAGVPSKCHTLLIGPSGSGKTYTIESELEKLGKTKEVPIIKIDATTLTRAGWEGTSLMDYLYPAAITHEENFKHAIVYVDEMDKIAKTSDKQGHYRGIQTNFLTFLDGGVQQLTRPRMQNLPVNFDNVTFIFSGAFQDLWDEVKTPIGFTGTEDQAAIDKEYHDRLVDYGFIKEIIYRVPYVIELKPYDREELESILNVHFGYKQMTDLFGVKINRNELLDYVQAHPAGARAIQIFLSKADLKHLSSEEELDGPFSEQLRPLRNR